MGFIDPGDRLLFQGDSITAAPDGYATLLASRLDGVTCLNRGVSGDRVTDLFDRWQRDTIDLKPDVISILVGINDTWHKYVTGEGVSVKHYERVYRELLEWTRRELSAVRLILCEPFYTNCGAVLNSWVPEIAARQAIVKQLADEFDGLYVPFHRAFGDAVDRKHPPKCWAEDGVHPTPAGHELMAETWLDVVQRDG